MNHTGTIIHMRNIPGCEKGRALDAPLPCLNQDGSMGEVPVNFDWDGSSVPWIFQGLFPRHHHPIASCRHDWRCMNAKNAMERKWADGQFREDVGTTSWWITKQIGYLGVRIGAHLGVGVHY
jgi:hypothetical protein